MKKRIVKEKNKKLLKISRILVNVFFILTVIIMLFYITFSLLQPARSMDIFKVRLYNVLTNSMEPTIAPGAMVLVKKADAASLKEGDIITFYADINLDGKKEVVTHYFAARETDSSGREVIRTKREGASRYDSWRITENDIIGQYVFHIPFIGRVFQFIKSPVGIITLGVDISIALFAYYMISKFCTEEECSCEYGDITDGVAECNPKKKLSLKQ